MNYKLAGFLAWVCQLVSYTEVRTELGCLGTGCLEEALGLSE